MNAIIQLALEAKGFTIEQVANILLVAEGSGNKTVAIETILGVYEHPTIARESDIKQNAVLISYDRFKEKVNYTYDYQRTRGASFHNNTPKENICLANFNELKSGSGNGDTYYHTIPTGEIEQRTETVALDRWTSKAVDRN